MATSESGSSTPEYRRSSRLDSESRRFGGVKIGSGFFGWLTATGMTVLLTALMAGVAAAMGGQLGRLQVQEVSGGLNILGTIILAVILFASYYCGGYVAGRMARFNGIRQGLAVWLWAMVIALVLGLLSLLAANQADVLNDFGGFLGIRLEEVSLMGPGLVVLLVSVIVPLLGSLLGGLAGMRFHRKVDHLGVQQPNAG